ncbi:MAG: succinate dehydrogenase [Planctomycetes bacterium]|nr:succinate dehydrogenase [Planctomycetota bacterium]
METNRPFLVRHEFLLRRLHSLSGLVPVGAYMVIHLLANASIWNGPATYQSAVHQIHSLGRALIVVEWVFIFLPILFHGLYGLVIIRESQPNSGAYPLVGNIRYTLQRATGMIALLFIVWHVFHMHGWFHGEAWRELIDPWGAQFAPYNAASTAAEAVQQSTLVTLLYAVGITACVFHLANGVWTIGITWGVWTTPGAQRRANYVAGAIGLGVLAVGLAAWAGFAFGVRTSDPEAMDAIRAIERRLLQEKIDSGLITEEQASEKSAHFGAPTDR